MKNEYTFYSMININIFLIHDNDIEGSLVYMHLNIYFLNAYFCKRCEH